MNFTVDHIEKDNLSGLKSFGNDSTAKIHGFAPGVEDLSARRREIS
jgi:hypothetical protein